MSVLVGIRRLANHDPDLPLPFYASDQAAGLDLSACLAPNDRMAGLWLEPRARLLVPTGLALEIPDDFEVQLRPRSGLALKHGITLLNAPGTIDADYRGEIGVIVVNHGTERFQITHGMRIAQMVLAALQRLAWRETRTVAETVRGGEGFGSTGIGTGQGG